MIDLATYRLNSYQSCDQFYHQLIERIGEGIPLDLVKLSALGARICYASEHPYRLWTQDKRITDEEEMTAFLNRCFKAGHFSIFAHTPIFLKGPNPYPSYLPYKAFSYAMGDECFVCANWRHYVEWAKPIKAPLLVEFKGGSRLLGPFIYTEGMNDWNMDEVVITNPNKYFLLFLWKEEPWYWVSVILHGVSRAMTHQFVRHTWLNFSQRSHRYTETEGVICPPSIQEKPIINGLVAITTAQIFDEVVHNCKMAYDLLVKHGIKKEDARYLYPTGAETTIMASGPLFVWQDFIEKRAIPNAQWEIRNVALALKKFFDEYLEEV